VPPAFSQSAWFFALVTSPAKAGPVKASVKANANIEMSVFMGFLPYAYYLGAVDNGVPASHVPGQGRPGIARHCSRREARPGPNQPEGTDGQDERAPAEAGAPASKGKRVGEVVVTSPFPAGDSLRAT
jgi:hypothetical protein